MFRNPGKKVKGISIALFVISLVAFVVVGIYVMMNGRHLLGDETMGYVLGAAAIVVGFLVSWLSAIFLYAWGSLADDVQTIRERLDYTGR